MPTIDTKQMHKRYFKNGRPVLADEALDMGGVLKDGYSTTVPTRLRDGANNTRLRITDAAGQHGENGSANRPGWRLPSDPYLKDQTTIAYSDYLQDLTTSWMGDKKKFTVRNRRGGEEETIEETGDDDEDAVLEAVQNSGVERAQRTDAATPLDHKTDVAKMRKDHEVRMQALYDERDREDAEAYKMKETYYE